MDSTDGGQEDAHCINSSISATDTFTSRTPSKSFSSGDGGCTIAVDVSAGGGGVQHVSPGAGGAVGACNMSTCPHAQGVRAQPKCWLGGCARQGTSSATREGLALKGWHDMLKVSGRNCAELVLCRHCMTKSCPVSVLAMLTSLDLQIEPHRHFLRAQLQLQPRLHAGRHLLLQVRLELFGLRRRGGWGRSSRPLVHQTRGAAPVCRLHCSEHSMNNCVVMAGVI